MRFLSQRNIKARTISLMYCSLSNRGFYNDDITYAIFEYIPNGYTFDSRRDGMIYRVHGIKNSNEDLIIPLKYYDNYNATLEFISNIQGESRGRTRPIKNIQPMEG